MLGLLLRSRPTLSATGAKLGLVAGSTCAPRLVISYPGPLLTMRRRRLGRPSAPLGPSPRSPSIPTTPSPPTTPGWRLPPMVDTGGFWSPVSTIGGNLQPGVVG